MQYTLPQITELVKRANRYIQFEVETRMMPMMGFGGYSKSENDEFKEADENDISDLISALSGG